MCATITFTNHAPIRIASADEIATIWSAGWDFGHHRLKRYTTKRGNQIFWMSENCGNTFNGHEPETERYYLRDVAAVKAYFVGRDLENTYLAKVAEVVDPQSIEDVDSTEG